MIPTIETIVEELAAGKITKQQAIAWLNQHAEDAGYNWLDEIAGKAMQGLVGFDVDVAYVAERSYRQAEAMLAERKKLGDC